MPVLRQFGLVWCSTGWYQQAPQKSFTPTPTPTTPPAGGVAACPGFRERFTAELRALVPDCADLNVFMPQVRVCVGVAWVVEAYLCVCAFVWICVGDATAWHTPAPLVAECAHCPHTPYA